MFRECQAPMANIAASVGLPGGPNAARALFAMAVAHRFAPYGASTALRFAAIRQARALACDSAAALLYHVYRRIGGGADDLRFVGWDHGQIGNHAHVWLGDLLLDPTVGIAAGAPLAVVRGGHGINPGGVIDLSAHDVLRGFKGLVIWALEAGRYRAADVIYDRTAAAFRANVAASAGT